MELNLNNKDALTAFFGNHNDLNDNLMTVYDRLMKYCADQCPNPSAKETEKLARMQIHFTKGCQLVNNGEMLLDTFIGMVTIAANTFFIVGRARILNQNA